MMKRGRAKPKHVCPVGGIIGMICGIAALCFGVAVAISVIGDIGGVMRSLLLTIAFSCSAAGLSGAAGGLIAFFRDAEVGAVAEMVAAEFSIVLCVITSPGHIVCDMVHPRVHGFMRDMCGERRHCAARAENGRTGSGAEVIR